MRVNMLECLVAGVPEINIDGTVYSAESLEHSFAFYVNGIVKGMVPVPSRILAVSICRRVIVVLANEMRLYQYSRDGISHVEEIPHERIVWAMAVQEYILVRLLKHGGTLHHLYNADHGAVFKLHSPGKAGIQSISRREEVSVVCVSTSGGLQCMACDELGFRVSESPPEGTARAEHIKTVFLDKRNILQVTSSSIEHARISFHRELMSGDSPDLSETSSGLCIKCSAGTYYIHRDGSRYKISTKSAPRPEDMPVQTHGDGTGALTPISIASYMHTYTFGGYMHRVTNTGEVKIFAVHGGGMEYARSVGPINAHNLTGFYAFSTHTGSILVLLYKSRFSVQEYAWQLDAKSTLSAPEGIKSVRKFRKDVVIEHSAGHTVYSVGKNKALRAQALAIDKGQTLWALDSPNMNMQHSPVLLEKEEGMVAVRWNGSVVARGRSIGNFHLLHTGYVYSDGFSLVLDSGRISFAFPIRALSVYNTASRSTVLVHLSVGAVYMLSVVEGKVAGRLELFQKVHSETVRMVSLDSFLTVEEGTLTVYGGDTYIQPVVRVPLCKDILDVFAGGEEILIMAEDSSIYKIDKKREIAPTPQDQALLGVSWRRA
ncbi:uncharacterized protein NEMAJ01_1702 [Nematocida major]|uniref:uncharacterized protein n=1 Tax=Nematocida major TaxID=1912982 RepID=UPI002008033A|nr:uncharacterized protein NEMAJ01_1702 [Nematocida major]KAH9386806.1 hypothetical protein NEMAJ01_1702 [Nematocida major]